MADVQEEIRDKSVALVIKVGKIGAEVGKTGGKLTVNALKWAMRQYLNHHRHPHGKQTVRQLVRQNDGVKDIEIKDKNIKSFRKIARKYGMDFAVKKDPSEGKYIVFFKARDEAAMTAAFAEYTDKRMGRKGQAKPSIRAQLQQNQEKLKHQERAVTQHLNKGGMEL